MDPFTIAGLTTTGSAGLDGAGVGGGKLKFGEMDLLFCD
jgi:hypothetical protein